jgi:sugar phosphate isomerase/epimerase
MTVSDQRIGVQLYSVRELAERDLERALESVAAIGYEGVEFAGLFGNDAARIRGVLDRLGLTAIGGHIQLADLEERGAETIRDLLALRCGSAIIAWLPAQLYDDEAAARRTVDRLIAAGDVARAAGLGFAYHNHDFEFQRIGTSNLWSMLTALDADALPLEIDVYWVRHGGLEPADEIRRLGQKVRLIHAKDTAADGRDAPVGKGIERWPEVLSACRNAGVGWLIVEQEQSSDILADLTTSLETLRRLAG